MSIEQPDVVDIMSIDRMTGHVVLTISDHLEWTDSTGAPDAPAAQVELVPDFC